MEILNHFAGIPDLGEDLAKLAVVFLLFRLTFGVLNCFMGYRLMKVWVAVSGFLLGAVAGFLGAGGLLTEMWQVMLIAAATGAVLGILGYEVYLVGALFMGWLFTVYGVIQIVRPLDIPDKYKLLLMAAGALLGILTGVLVVVFARPSIVLLTGIFGGISAGTAFMELLGLAKQNFTVKIPISGWEVGLILGLIGVIVQFVTTRKNKSVRSFTEET